MPSLSSDAFTTVAENCSLLHTRESVSYVDRGENAVRFGATRRRAFNGCPVEARPKRAIKSSRRLWRETGQLTTPFLTHLARAGNSYVF